MHRKFNPPKLITKQQLEKIEQLQTRNKELEESTLKPYSIIATTLLSTLASQFLLDDLLKVLFSNFQKTQTNAITSITEKSITTAVSGLKKTLEAVLTSAKLLPSIADDPISKFKLLAKKLDDPFHYLPASTIAGMKKFYTETYASMAFFLPQEKNLYNRKFFLPENELSTLKQKSFSFLAELITESYETLNTLIIADKNHRGELFETYKKSTNDYVFKEIHFQFLAAFVVFTCLIRHFVIDGVINRIYHKLYSLEISPSKHTTSERANEIITSLISKNHELRNKSKRQLYVMGSLMLAAISVPAYEYYQDEENYPTLSTFLFSILNNYPALSVFILSFLTSMMFDFCKLLKEECYKSIFENKIKKIHQYFNNTVACTHIKWDVLANDSVENSFLSFTAKKIGNLSPKIVYKIVKAALLANNINVYFDKQHFRLTVDANLPNEKAEKINQEISNNLNVAEKAIPIQRLFTPASQKETIIKTPYKITKVLQQNIIIINEDATSNEEKKRDVIINKPGYLVQRNHSLLFIHAPTKESKVTEDDIRDLLNIEAQEEIEIKRARKHGQIGAKRSTNGKTDLKHPVTDKRISLEIATPVIATVDGVEQSVPSSHARRLYKK